MISETAEQKQTRVYLLAKNDVALQWQLPAGARYNQTVIQPAGATISTHNQRERWSIQHPKYYSLLRSTVLTRRFSYVDEVLGYC